MGASCTLKHVSILKTYHKTTGQNRNSAMYQGRQQYEYNLCHKNHVRFTITEFYDAVSHETKLFLISEGLYMPRVIQDCPFCSKMTITI
jgi:hypothetical protein